MASLLVEYKATRRNKIFRRVPVQSEHVAELMAGIDVRGHAETEHYSVFTVENQRSVDHVDEEVDVPRISKVAHHGFKHLSY